MCKKQTQGMISLTTRVPDESDDPKLSELSEESREDIMNPAMRDAHPA